MRSLYAGGGGRSVHPFSYRVGHAGRGKRWPIEVLPRRVVNGRTAFAFRHGRAFRSTPFRAFRNGPQHGPFVFFRAASPSSTASFRAFQIKKYFRAVPLCPGRPEKLRMSTLARWNEREEKHSIVAPRARRVNLRREDDRPLVFFGASRDDPRSLLNRP